MFEAWIEDLQAKRLEYEVIRLDEPPEDELRTSEEFWILAGVQFNWPLTNDIQESVRERARTARLEAPPQRRWNVKQWRRDPEVQRALSAAKKRPQRP